MFITTPARLTLRALQGVADMARPELRRATGLDDVALTGALVELDHHELVRSVVDCKVEPRVVRWGAIT